MFVDFLLIKMIVVWYLGLLGLLRHCLKSPKSPKKPQKPSRNNGHHDFTPGAFFAAGIFPAEAKVNRFGTVAFVEGQREGRTGAERGVGKRIDRRGRRVEDCPPDFRTVYAGGFRSGSSTQDQSLEENAQRAYYTQGSAPESAKAVRTLSAFRFFQM
jgi:hypothetical protein